eukprot:CCRYP_009434-RC/>CCRYP_009434-RC protein AED:0.02 eAED:0.02 QI:966/1/1/1/1/1/2/399/375
MLMSAYLSYIFFYLDGEDLMNTGFTCSSLLSQAEKVAMEIVKSVNHQYVSGPIKRLDDTETDPTKIRFFLEGTNTFYLRAPIDEQDFDEDLFDAKKWLPLLRRMERMTQEIYYLGFEVALGDYSAPSRFLRNQEKLAFKLSILLNSTWSMTSYFPPRNLDNPRMDNITIRAGYVQVTQEIASIPPNSDNDELIFSVNKKLTEGVHRIICRFACNTSLLPGSVGILGHHDDGMVVWEAQLMVCLCFEREAIVGLEYDSIHHSLRTYSIIENTIRVESFSINQTRGQLYFAAAFSRVSAVTTYNQLSVRECCPEEWAKFITHTPHLLKIPQLELIPEGDMMHILFGGTRNPQSLNVNNMVGLSDLTMFVQNEAAAHE